METYQIWWLIKPSQLILYSAIIGIILHRSRLGKSLLFSVAALLIACALLPIGALLTVPLESRFQRPDNLLQPDGIIVLAGAEQPGLTSKHVEPMLNKSADRLTTFLRLAHQYPSARLVHAGSGGEL